MDPLYTLVNQNRLLDNTQRSSDNLKAQAIKEGKEKSKRTGEIDDSDLSGDINSMGEDLLGSMDPDLFGKGGGAKAFKQMWEEALAEDEEEEKKEEGEGQGQGKEGEQQDGAPGEESPQAFAVAPPTVSDELPGATAAAPPPDPAAEKAEAATVTLSTEARHESRAPQDGAREEVELTGAQDKRKNGASADAPTWSSLLDLTGGFLLAEEVLPELADDEDTGPPLEDVPDVCPSVVDLLERLIVGDATTTAFRRLQHLLGRFGAGVLRTCLEQKSRVFLLPRGEGLGSHPLVASSGMEDARGAVYLTASRSCVVEEELLSSAPLGFHPVLYYFAHAFDHALGGEDFASLRSPAVGASFQACQQGGHQFADPLAATSPVHYFAQAVESYLNENDCYDPLWTKADLYDFDRSMYEYVDYLFKRANK